MTAGEPMSLRQLMSNVVGSGPRSAEDMTRAQARAAFQQILDSEPDPTTLGAFLLANRWKRNTPTELAAFIDVMIEESVTRATPEVPVVDCGANYDGKERTALLGVAGGLVAAAAGTPVVVHSGDRIPVQEACAYKHVLDELDVPTDLSPEASARMTEDVGFGFYYQPRFNAGIHSLLDRRTQMGVRTFINTIETLANPASASVHLGSFYHLEFGKKLVDAIETSEHAGFERAVLFQGIEGYDDVRPGYTKVAEWDGTSFESDEIESDAFDIIFETDDLAVDDVAADSARLTEAVIGGDRSDQFADATILNAAVRLYAGRAVDDIADGIELARQTLTDGAAATVLDELQQVQSADIGQ